MKKFFITTVFCIFIGIGLILFFYIKNENEIYKNGQIKIFCWGQYIADGSDGSINVLNQFEKENKIKIKAFNTFDSCEQMYTKLKNGNSKYDIIFCCEYMVKQLIDEKLIIPIDVSCLENYKNIMDNFKGSFWGYDRKDRYSIPYCWGHLGIIYNKQLVENLTGEKAEDVVQGWEALWDERLKQQILMFINSRDSFSIAQKFLNNSINTTNQSHILDAFNLLKKQKPLVQAYVMDEIFDKMENNEAAISVAYSGDIVNMMKNNKQLRYCFPKQGSNIYIDTICIPYNSKNINNALKFIDFLCRADIAIENAKFSSFSTPNIKAFNLLDSTTKNNKIAYPNKNIIEKCEINLPFSKRQNTLIENLFIKVKT